MTRVLDPPWRNDFVLRKYGLTWNTYVKLWYKQKGRCAVCNERMLGRDCHIDHDHETNLRRALLCHNCNAGLGMFHDNIRLLANAIVYLEEHGKSF